MVGQDAEGRVQGFQHASVCVTDDADSHQTHQSHDQFVTTVGL
jgi:hypothetical protein